MEEHHFRSLFEGAEEICKIDSISEEEGERDENQKSRLLENKCKVKGHKGEDLLFVCTHLGCKNILLCKRCKKKHIKFHGESIKILDEWFNGMFGRRVEDSENNKVSRKCGMNLGRLQEVVKNLEMRVEDRKRVFAEQTKLLILNITQYIQEKNDEAIGQLEGKLQAKRVQLEEQQQTYKKLKSMNRFTVLENLKRQHDPNQLEPPKIPIQSIIQFLLANEKQFSDLSQIESQHKRLSKLMRDTESLEQAINNEIKQISQAVHHQKIIFENQNEKKQKEPYSEDKNRSKRENISKQPQNSLFLTRIHECIDEIYCFEKKKQNAAISKKVESQLILEKNMISQESEKEILEYECLAQENFRTAQFIDFSGDSIHVFADQLVSLYDIQEGSFSKTQNLKASQQIVSRSQEMYEIGAIQQVNFFDGANDPPSQSYLPLLIIGLKNDPAKIEIWDMNINKQLCEYQQAHDCSITCIKLLKVIQNTSILFAVGSYDGVIKTWLFSRQNWWSLSQQLTLRCHTDFVTCMIVFRIKDDPEKEYLLSAGSDRKMVIWNWHQGERNELAQNNDNEEISQRQFTDKIMEDTSQSSEIGNQPEQIKKRPMFMKKQIHIKPLTKQLLSAHPSQQSSDVMIKPLKVMDNVHADKINCFEILDQGYLASGSSDNTIKVWDMDTQVEHKRLQNTFIVNSICRLNRGMLVSSANNVKMNIYLINIWNWEMGQIVGVIKGHTGRITKLHVLSDMNTIVSCERNKVIRIWHQSNMSSSSSEDEQNNHLSLTDETSKFRKSLSFLGTSPVEEFLNNFHIELDTSLTPKSSNIIQLPFEHTLKDSSNLTQTPQEFSHFNNIVLGQNKGELISLPATVNRRLFPRPSFDDTFIENFIPLYHSSSLLYSTPIQQISPYTIYSHENDQNSQQLSNQFSQLHHFQEQIQTSNISHVREEKAEPVTELFDNKDPVMIIPTAQHDNILCSLGQFKQFSQEVPSSSSEKEQQNQLQDYENQPIKEQQQHLVGDKKQSCIDKSISPMILPQEIRSSEPQDEDEFQQKKLGKFTSNSQQEMKEKFLSSSEEESRHQHKSDEINHKYIIHDPVNTMQKKHFKELDDQKQEQENIISLDLKNTNNSENTNYQKEQNMCVKSFETAEVITFEEDKQHQKENSNSQMPHISVSAQTESQTLRTRGTLQKSKKASKNIFEN